MAIESNLAPEPKNHSQAANGTDKGKHVTRGVFGIGTFSFGKSFKLQMQWEKFLILAASDAPPSLIRQNKEQKLLEKLQNVDHRQLHLWSRI